MLELLVITTSYVSWASSGFLKLYLLNWYVNCVTFFYSKAVQEAFSLFTIYLQVSLSIIALLPKRYLSLKSSAVIN